jgi:type IV secretory pathway TrbF-like protein
MFPRSAAVKLKAILVIDLIIISVAAGAYFYLQKQGVIAGVAIPAKFTVIHLTINPSNATLGDAVQISVNVTNVGDLEGNETVNFEINSVVKDSQNITLAGAASENVTYNDVETTVGSYSVQVGDLTGAFTINPPPPGSSSIILSNIYVNPYEAWPDQPVNVTATAQNPTTKADTLFVTVTVDNVPVETKLIQVNASSSETEQFTFNATTVGEHTIKLNTLSTEFTVVKTGYHTLLINRNGGGSIPLTFTLNGVSYNTPFEELLPDGTYTISVPNPVTLATGVLGFSSWQDGVTSTTRTFNLNQWTIMVATYTIISGYASCPSLFVWNGTGYSYVTDVSNSGWLGYMNYMTSSGNIVYGGGTPWDYVKLNPNLLAVKNIDGNGYYDMILAQQWDEIFYLDTAYMVVVDHPMGTNAYATMSNYVNQGFNGQIYTVSQTNILTPVSATYVWGPAGTTEKGINVLPEISKLDGVFTPGNSGVFSPAWNDIYLNQLTLDLGNLSGAKDIKLVINGIVNWGNYQDYYNWIDQFKNAAAAGVLTNGTQIYPAPYMEVKDANGNWVRVPQDKQIPMPSDSNARTFVVDLTGDFPSGISDYQVKICNFWNVTYDYIGIDTTTQQKITIQKIMPIATLSQWGPTQSTSSGDFTRYGDVTALLQSADNMYVIGRQGDEVSLQFPVGNLTKPAPGMERDYFLFVACWFKDPPGQWGYGFTFTVDPLPFVGMSGYPYTTAESYPYDAAHLAYLKEYNTRVIPPAS